ncbi:hypothetical protein ES708_21408 [subsurface metagenome]
MKTVYIMRHGKAVTRDNEAPDYDRTLIERGRNDAQRMAGKLKKKGIIPSLIVSSPAPRALETAKIIAEQCELPQNKIRTRKALYDQTANAMKTVIKGIDNELDSVMLVGHDPAFTEFALSNADGFTGLIPTSGVVGIEYKVDSWIEVAGEKGLLSLFMVPGKKGKEKTPKPSLKKIDKRLAEQVMSFLIELNKKTAGKMKKTVTISCSEIAKKFQKSMKNAAKSNKKNKPKKRKNAAKSKKKNTKKRKK